MNVEELKRQAEQYKGKPRLKRYYDTLMKQIAELEKAQRGTSTPDVAVKEAAPKKAKKK